MSPPWSTFADADRHDVVFVPNTTTGIESVVQSVARTLGKGDSILMTSLAYGKLLTTAVRAWHSWQVFCYYIGTIEKFVKRVELETEIRVDKIEITFPIESQDTVHACI